MSSWGDISGLNRGYVLELYEKFRRDPSSVDAATRELFTRWAPPPEVDVESPAPARSRPAPTSKATDPALLQKVVGAVSLAQSIRRYGHLAAKLDPLGVCPPSGDPSLLPESHSVTEEDLRQLPATLIRSPLAAGAAHVAEVLEALRRLYCSRIGYDYAHVFVPEERRWLRNAVETGQFRSPNDPIDPVALLKRLSQVEAFERFLHRTFPGKTRFSIEGTDMLVPILDEVIGEAALVSAATFWLAWRTVAASTSWRTCSTSRMRRFLPSSRIPSRHERSAKTWRGLATSTTTPARTGR